MCPTYGRLQQQIPWAEAYSRITYGLEWRICALCQIMTQKATVQILKKYLRKWLWPATHSRLEPMRDFAGMLHRHEDDILNCFKMPIDNGTVEGLNTEAELVIHKAYGSRTAANYIRNLYHRLGRPAATQTVHTCDKPPT